jgi:membrane associated rhomboid family serine protease
VEGLRIVLPLALVIATGYLIVVLVMPLADDNGWGLKVAGALALAGCLYGVASFLLVVALKWIARGPLPSPRRAHVDALRLDQRSRHQFV